MKIEIGESLVYSWLRHVKGCQIVQTNWKPSPKWECHRETSKEVLNLINPYFGSQNLDVFGENSLDQLIAQAEIDDLGVYDDHCENGLMYYFVDIAFHEGSLNYGAKNETICRVLKKFIRTYFVYLSYFDTSNPCMIFFVSPKVSINTIVTPLTKHIMNLTKILNDSGYKPDFKMVLNEDFKNEILDPTIRTANEVADSSELFMRSYQLLRIFPNIKKTTQQKHNTVVDDQNNKDQPRNQNDFRKINRIYRWAEHPEQINHKIIKAFLYLEEKFREVSLLKLEQQCAEKGSAYFVENFQGNFNSMKTDEGSSHGKCFYLENGCVRMYDQVREVVNNCFR